MPPKLIVLSEQLRGQTFELTGPSYAIGRSENAEICIPDPTISGKHCELVKIGEDEYQVVDAGSTNGTRINGIRVTEQKMVNSDILQVGGVEIMFDCEDQSLTQALSTQTGINLEETAGGIQLQEMDNLSEFKRGKGGGEDNKVARLVFGGVIAILVIVVLILAFVLVSKMMSDPGA
jgi:pSer/pThr/pTyr-binding forkhead associated (FHA) protein